MMKMIKFPSIMQFRNIVKTIQDKSCFVGLDEEGNAKFDYLKTKPTLTFQGTVKLHGTNAAVCFNTEDGLWVQSRENIITAEKDNAACAFNVETNKSSWLKIIDDLARTYAVDLSKNTISIYFEWTGKGIQKGVGISELEKTAFIFSQFKVSPYTEETAAYWLPTCIQIGGEQVNVSDIDNRIYNVLDFKTYSVEIDFNQPEKVQNQIINMTLEVEDTCPVARELGVVGIGEGIVFECFYEGERYIFKSKGEKHSKSRVKKLKPVDLEKLEKVDQCVEAICHDWRFEQGLTEVFGMDYENTLDRKKMGEYLKWVGQDTLKEESDLIVKWGFEPKEVMNKVNLKAKEYFLSKEKF
jgi:hypothetical protein